MESYQQDGEEHDAGVDTSSYPVVAVCIDKGGSSQAALKWAVETLAHKGQTIVLVHVNTDDTASAGVEDAAGFKQPTDPHLNYLFLPFRYFCTRKKVRCKAVVLDDHDVAKSIVEFSARGAVEKLVVGAAAAKGLFQRRSKAAADIPTTICKGAPDFCTVYVVSKGKAPSVRCSTGQAPREFPLRSEIQSIRDREAANPPAGPAAPPSHIW